MSRIFLDSTARFYKSDEPKHADDAEILNPTREQMEYCSETPKTVSELADIKQQTQFEKRS